MKPIIELLFHVIAVLLVACTSKTHAQTQQGPNPYFAPYLHSGELPDGSFMPLFSEVWRIMGYQLMQPNFTAQVDKVSQSIFAVYHYHGQATGVKVGPAAPVYLDGHPVAARHLEGDAFSDQMLADYNAVDVSLNITIDNQAWYPDLGNVAKTNHNRLANIMTSQGYTVEAWICTSYILSQQARRVLGQMPIPLYNSFLVDLKVTGSNLVPMTAQKQNAVIAVLEDLMAFAGVWYIRCIAVNQTSLQPGAIISSANVTIAIQQDADALSVRQALQSIVNDTLGTPLFEARTAALNLPLSASVISINTFVGDSITDQINSSRPPHRMAKWKVAVITVAAVAGALLCATVVFLVWVKKLKLRPAGGKWTPQVFLELQQSNRNSNTSSGPTRLPQGMLSCIGANLPRAKTQMARSGSLSTTALMTAASSGALPDPESLIGQFAAELPPETPTGAIRHRARRRASGLDERQLQAFQIDAGEIEICVGVDGQEVILGAGTYGIVSRARWGDRDVAVKTIHRDVLCPEGPDSPDWSTIQRELNLHQLLSYDKNLVQFYGSCVKQGNIYLVLEYMEGGNLRKALQTSEGRRQLNWYCKGRNIALDIIRGLQYLHSQSVLHRDIKSGNVLLSADFSVAKICDIGLGHIMGDSSLSPPAAQSTFAYAAPEMLLNLRCNAKADVFSYGVVLWELITQEQPQRGHIRDLEVPSECPQAVAAIVDACLDHRAEQRPSTQQIIDVISEGAATDR